MLPDVSKDWFEMTADSLLHALGTAFAMGWEILWPLIPIRIGSVVDPHPTKQRAIEPGECR